MVRGAPGGARLDSSGGRLRRVLAVVGAIAGLVGGTVSVGLAASAAVDASTVNVPCTGPTGGEAGLKKAINDANSAGGGTINLAGSCTYTLTTAADPTDAVGLPKVATKITLNGGNATTITRRSTATAFGIFLVDRGGALTLNHLAVTQGRRTTGAGIDNLGTLHLVGTTVSHNVATSDGGGINSSDGATATLSATVVSDNAAGHDGGGVINTSSSTTGSTMTITGSLVSNNTASDTGGGVFNGFVPNKLDLTSTSVQGNRAKFAGGISNFSALSLTSSRVADNRATLFGGGIDSESGVLPATMTLTGSQITGNTAQVGGGFQNFCATAMVNESQVAFNRAPAGAGIENFCAMKQARLTLVKASVTNNTASGPTATGGGILNQKTVVVQGSLVSGNSVNASGGNAQGGGLFNSDLGSATLTDSVVAHNSAKASGGTAAGGGIFNENDVSGSIMLSRTLVTANTPNNCRPTGRVPGCTG